MIKIAEEFLKLLNRNRRGWGLPKDWRREINSIFKKGDRRVVKNYREVTLLNIEYNIYADVIHERLKRQVVISWRKDNLEKLEEQ